MPFLIPLCQESHASGKQTAQEKSRYFVGAGRTACAAAGAGRAAGRAGCAGAGGSSRAGGAVGGIARRSKILGCFLGGGLEVGERAGGVCRSAVKNC